MSNQQFDVCEFCGSEHVSERKGRGTMLLCDGCDTWISDRMRSVDVVLPEDRTSLSARPLADPERGQSLAVDPSLSTSDALAYTQVSFETIGYLEAAGYTTAADLWDAGVEELSAVDTVNVDIAESIMESISTTAMRDSSNDTGLDDLFG